MFTMVSTQIVMAIARGVITSHNANLLAENGGYMNQVTIIKDENGEKKRHYKSQSDAC